MPGVIPGFLRKSGAEIAACKQTFHEWIECARVCDRSLARQEGGRTLPISQTTSFLASGISQGFHACAWPTAALRVKVDCVCSKDALIAPKYANSPLTL